MPLIKIDGLKLQFPGRHGPFLAVDDISFELQPGEILGLVGESGAGKSTVGNAIMGLVEDPGKITGGVMDFQGRSYALSDQQALAGLRGSNISMIFQDPLTSLNPLFTIEQQLVETILRHRQLTTKAARARALELLNEVGVRDAEEKILQYPHQFSGGMRQRVVIALALCSEPSLIIADEPTTALDVSIQARILTLIRKLAVDRKVGIILVTHDMGVISEVTDRVAVMYRGKIVEIGPTYDVLQRPQHDYTRSLISVVPRSDVKLDRFPEVDYIERAPKHSALADIGSHWVGRGDNRSTATPDGLILSIKNASISFVTRNSIFPSRRKIFTAVKGFSLDIQEGEVVGLVGESGSGKSTIARMVAGIYSPSDGDVSFKGVQLRGLKAGKIRRNVRREIQMIFQDPYSSINPRMRVGAIVSEPILHFGLADSSKEANTIVGDLLEMVGLGAAAAEKFPHEFSGGQRQRICIARALAARPRFLICDEPTSALDVSIQAQILNLLKDLQRTLKLSMLFISHDLPVVRQMSDKIAVMRNGELCEWADTAELFDRPQHPYTKELLSLMPKLA